MTIRGFLRILFLAFAGLPLFADVTVEQGRTHTASGAFGCSVSGATVATPSVITCSAAHGLIDGDQVQITGVGGTTTVNTTAFVKVTGYSATTFALFSNAALTTGVTGTGAYTSGGKVSIARDVSAVIGDYTLRLSVTGPDSGKTALVCIQDSTDGFVSDIVTLFCVNQPGGYSGTAGPPVWTTVRAYQIPSARLGAVNARLRLSVQALSAGASVVTSLIIEQ